MAGKPGRSGGARRGAGRKPKPVQKLEIPPTQDALTFLLAVMNDPAADAKTRLRAAITATQYQHIKKGDGGKRDEQKEAAEKAAKGKFAPSRPPRLVVNNT